MREVLNASRSQTRLEVAYGAPSSKSKKFARPSTVNNKLTLHKQRTGNIKLKMSTSTTSTSSRWLPAMLDRRSNVGNRTDYTTPSQPVPNSSSTTTLAPSGSESFATRLQKQCQADEQSWSNHNWRGTILKRYHILSEKLGCKPNKKYAAVLKSLVKVYFNPLLFLCATYIHTYMHVVDSAFRHFSSTEDRLLNLTLLDRLAGIVRE